MKKYLVIMLVVILVGIRCTVFFMSLDDHSIHPISHDRMSDSLFNRLRHLYSPSPSTLHNINPVFTFFDNSSPSLPSASHSLSTRSNTNLTAHVYRVQQETGSSKTSTTSNTYSGRRKRPHEPSARFIVPPRISLPSLLSFKRKSHIISRRVLKSLSTRHENTPFAFKPTPLSHLSVFNNSLPTSSLITHPYSLTANAGSHSQSPDPVVGIPRLNNPSNFTLPTATAPFLPPPLYDSTYNFSRPSSTASAASLLLPSALGRQCYTYIGLTAKNNCCHTHDFRANNSALLLQCVMAAATSPKHR